VRCVPKVAPLELCEAEAGVVGLMGPAKGPVSVGVSARVEAAMSLGGWVESVGYLSSALDGRLWARAGEGRRGGETSP
jgi:hypothetical protein